MTSRILEKVHATEIDLNFTYSNSILGFMNNEYLFNDLPKDVIVNLRFTFDNSQHLHGDQFTQWIFAENSPCELKIIRMYV